MSKFEEEEEEAGRGRKVFISVQGFASALEQGRAGAGQAGGLCRLPLERRRLRHGFIALFKLVGNFRTSDTPYSNAGTKTPSKPARADGRQSSCISPDFSLSVAPPRG